MDAKTLKGWKLVTPEPADLFYHHWKLDNQVLCPSLILCNRKVQGPTFKVSCWKEKRKMREGKKTNLKLITSQGLNTSL